MWRDAFAALPVRDLPYPAHLFKCTHAGRFDQMLVRVRAANEPTEVSIAEVTRQFIGTLTARDVATCSFHGANWKAIANASAHIIDVVGVADSMQYRQAASAMKIAKRDRRWLDSLFHDPIVIDGGEYTNGQHRGCALRFSGAERAAVVVDHELLGEEPDDWTYIGDG